MKFRRRVASLLVLLCMLCAQFVQAAANPDSFHENYKLVQMVILSRHNIRAPLAGPGSPMYAATDHVWHDFGVNKGELTKHGGQMEKEMGAYFRLYAEREGLFPTGEPLPQEQVWFRANAFQRTIATARNFAVGFSPGQEITVHYKGNVGDADPLFMPGTEDRGAEFVTRNQQELAALGGSEALLAAAAPGVQVAARVLDRPVIDLSTVTVGVDTGFVVEGALRPIMMACDALILQHYELGDKRASFGHELSFQEWQQLAAVKDLGVHVYRQVPTFARAVARPLLTEMQAELDSHSQKFTFLCGHDINIAPVMGALEVKDMVLPETIEQEAPIGSKIVVEEWKNKKGESFVNLKLVYPKTSQLTGAVPLNADNPPEAVPLHLKNIRPNKDGLLSMQDFQQRITDAISSDEELLANR
ncbi:glucose-1-phosphatase [Selenomonas ruminantium]|uniref:Glucose-1-phosphatase n=1 Tax=Selenomonas ruminantium TaxID=971 RepID=A0A1M6VSF5_SELRU|nr:histidine-type phosphatase [Selenomonas ruminantium]SHK84314.1 glucose-1-phosphatase [Selenomonas ruminantium]